MYLKKFLFRFVGLIVADVVSAAKIRFTSWRVNHFLHPQLKEVIMSIIKKLVAPLVGLNPAGLRSAVQKLVLAKAGMQSWLFTLTLMVAALWVGSAVAAEKKMVMDPTTGEMVEAPRYGGTFTQAMRIEPARTSDPWFTYGANVGGVIEKLGIGNWAIDRDEFSFSGFYIPVSVLTGRLAESWEQTDPTTYVFKIRKGVHWHNKPPMNGRELTAYDIEWNYLRYTGMGDFTEAGPSPAVQNVANLPWESITATDKWTVVYKLKELNLDALQIILDDQAWILPPR